VRKYRLCLSFLYSVSCKFIYSLFRRVRKFAKATTNVVMSVRLSVRMEQLGFHRTDFHEILYLYIFRIAGSISDGVIRYFHWHNPPDRTMALESTQPLTEMSTRNISWGQRRPVPRVDNRNTFMYRLSWNLGASTFWSSQGLCRPVTGLLLYFSEICRKS
jgi:hypothetical protein